MRVNLERYNPTTIFDAIKRYGHDEDFEGIPDDRFQPTRAIPGSEEKIKVFQRRVELGHPLYHQDDLHAGPPAVPWEVPVAQTWVEDARKKKRKSE